MINSSSPLVSCIIPTKDRPELVSRAIRSVLNQTHQKKEIIVIDDSANDDTMHALSIYGKDIRYIKNETSRGACYSRNVGIGEAKGDFMAFLDDDDAWMTRKIESQLEFTRRYPIISCNNTTIIQGKKHWIRRPEITTYEKMLYHNYLGSCSFVLVDSKCLSGCFFDERLKAGQDWDMWLAVMKNNRIPEAAVAQQYLVDYNSGQHNRISSSFAVKKELMHVYNKYIDDHTGHSTRLFCLYNMLPAEKSFTVGLLRDFIKSKETKKGMLVFIKYMLLKVLRKTIIF